MILALSAIVFFCVVTFVFTTILDRRNFRELLKSFDIEKQYNKLYGK
jgi:hypothetical protein